MENKRVGILLLGLFVFFTSSGVLADSFQECVGNKYNYCLNSCMNSPNISCSQNCKGSAYNQCQKQQQDSQLIQQPKVIQPGVSQPGKPVFNSSG